MPQHVDYERLNAREWDTSYKEPEPPTTTDPGWQTVGSSRVRDPPKNTPQQQEQRRQAAKASPRKWQTSGAVRRGHNIRREPPQLARNADDEAEAAWRSLADPVDLVRIPEELLIKDKYGAPHTWHVDLAKQHESFIYSEFARASGGKRTFGIWGHKNAVDATKRAIAKWIEDTGYSSSKSAVYGRFAKVVSLTPKLRDRAEKRWEREVTKQKFRQHPPPDMAFGSIGSFLWPVVEYKPEEVLGSHFEALDPIRLDTTCYLVFHKERSLFRIMGKASDVQTGLQRLRHVCFQIAAKQTSGVRMYLLAWRDTSKLPLYVYLHDYHAPAVTSPSDIETQVRKAPRGDEYEPNETAAKQASLTRALNEHRLLSALLWTLSKLQYYQGHLQMRIRLGTFLVNQYREPEYGIYDRKEYDDMLRESQFSGEVTPELGHKATEDSLLPVLRAANDFLTPSEAMTTHLREVKPIYAAIFTFHDPAGHYRLTMEWQETHDAYRSDKSAATNFDVTSKKWTRLERDTTTPTPLLDVSLCNLAASSAWQFDLVACPKIVEESKLPQLLSKFTESLKIEPKKALDPNNEELFVRFSPYASLASVQQRISYQYTVSNSDYTLELSRFQDRTYPPRASLNLTSSLNPTVWEPRWGLSLFRKAWDSAFAGNEGLKIGKQVDWKADVKEWFPIDLGPGSPPEDEENAKQGWEQLMEKLNRVEDVVGDVRRRAEEDGDNETVVGGMKVD